MKRPFVFSALLSALFVFLSCGNDGRMDKSGPHPDANINSDPRNDKLDDVNAADSAGTGLSPDTAKRNRPQ